MMVHRTHVLPMPTKGPLEKSYSETYSKELGHSFYLSLFIFYFILQVSIFFFFHYIIYPWLLWPLDVAMFET
jgi:hypothetical protein